MPLTLPEAAEKAGVSIATIKKQQQRGQIRATKGDSGRLEVSEDDFALYLASRGLLEASETAEKGMPELPKLVHDVGDVFGALPAHIADAILAGVAHKGGASPEPFRAAMEGLGNETSRQIAEPSAEDPHASCPIGYRHVSSPAWGRVSELTWELNGGTYTWTGLFWEGGSVFDGRVLDEGISPASPYSDKRPSAPPDVKAKK
jgi:hypothetical protein